MRNLGLREGELECKTWSSLLKHIQMDTTVKMETYISFYSNRFKTNRFDKEGWKQDKAGKNRKKEWIRVELNDIKMSGPDAGGRIEVHFSQDYRSSNYSSKVSKLLVLEKEGNGWKIVDEKSF